MAFTFPFGAMIRGGVLMGTLGYGRVAARGGWRRLKEFRGFGFLNLAIWALVLTAPVLENI
jgi:hypothetical protein